MDNGQVVQRDAGTLCIRSCMSVCTCVFLKDATACSCCIDLSCISMYYMMKDSRASQVGIEEPNDRQIRSAGPRRFFSVRAAPRQLFLRRQCLSQEVVPCHLSTYHPVIDWPSLSITHQRSPTYHHQLTPSLPPSLQQRNAASISPPFSAWPLSKAKTPRLFPRSPQHTVTP